MIDGVLLHGIGVIACSLGWSSASMIEGVIAQSIASGDFACSTGWSLASMMKVFCCAESNYSLHKTQHLAILLTQWV